MPGEDTQQVLRSENRFVKLQRRTGMSFGAPGQAAFEFPAAVVPGRPVGVAATEAQRASGDVERDVHKEEYWTAFPFSLPEERQLLRQDLVGGIIYDNEVGISHRLTMI